MVRLQDLVIGVFLKPPCKDCTERAPGCHDKCQKYQEFKVEKKRRKEEKAKDNLNKMWRRY